MGKSMCAHIRFPNAVLASTGGISMVYAGTNPSLVCRIKTKYNLFNFVARDTMNNALTVAFCSII